MRSIHVLLEQGGGGSWLKIARRRDSRYSRAAKEANEQLAILAWGGSNERFPVIVVEILSWRRVGFWNTITARIVVELDPQDIELSLREDSLHIEIRV